MRNKRKGLSRSPPKAVVTKQQKLSMNNNNSTRYPVRNSRLDLAPPKDTPPPVTTSLPVTSMPSTSSTDLQEASVKSAKPIIVNANYAVISNLLKSLPNDNKPQVKILRGSRVQIMCSSTASKKAVIKELETKMFKFHTFTEPGERSAVFVLHGHPHTAVDDLRQALSDFGLPAKKVTFLRDNHEYPVYLVHFEQRSMDLPTLVHRHKTIGQLIVRWELLDKSRKRPTQCRRCQLWGHSATNCGYDFRCAKCLAKHLPGECPRKTRENTAESTVKCVNCQQDHPANSSQCEAYRRYANRINKRRSAQAIKRLPLPEPPRRTDFAFLPSGRRQNFSAQPRIERIRTSYAQTLQQSDWNNQGSEGSADESEVFFCRGSG